MTKSHGRRRTPSRSHRSNYLLQALFVCCSSTCLATGTSGGPRGSCGGCPSSSTRFPLSFRKFGLRADVCADILDMAAAQALLMRLVGKLRSAVRILDDTTLVPLARAELAAGNVSVRNHQARLRGSYDYFRSCVDACLTGDGRWANKDEARRLFADRREAFINVVAAVNAYFSWLEHVLVLVLPFTDFDPRTDDLSKIISVNWGTKFRRVFDVATDPTANQLLGELTLLAERTRNTWVHGGFDKEGGLVYARIPAVGVMPVRVSRYDESVHFDPLGGMSFDFAELWALLDRVDGFLGSGKTEWAMKYVRWGLQVDFDEENRAEYAQASGDDT